MGRMGAERLHRGCAGLNFACALNKSRAPAGETALHGIVKQVRTDETPVRQGLLQLPSQAASARSTSLAHHAPSAPVPERLYSSTCCPVHVLSACTVRTAPSIRALLPPPKKLPLPNIPPLYKKLPRCAHASPPLLLLARRAQVSLRGRGHGLCCLPCGPARGRVRRRAQGGG